MGLNRIPINCVEGHPKPGCLYMDEDGGVFLCIRLADYNDLAMASTTTGILHHVGITTIKGTEYRLIPPGTTLEVT